MVQVRETPLPRSELGEMQDAIDEHRRTLERYRFLLRLSGDARAREALLELIAEAEERLRDAEAARARKP